MRQMKDSGYKWIGDIPFNWITVPLSSLIDDDKYAMVDGPFGSDMKNEEYVDSGVPIVQLTNIRPMHHNLDSIKYVTEEKATMLQRHNAKAGDLVIAKMMPAGRSCILSDDYDRYVICADVIKVSIDDLNIKRFIAYSMNSYGLIASEMKSSGSTRSRISLGIAKRIHVALPRSKDVSSIVNYLDSKCLQIDSIIEKQEAIIEKLKEYKLSVITEAVTKGLDPNVEMKDSGIEWIGRIPVSWSVVPLKKQLASIVDYRGKTPEKVDSGVFLVTAKNIKNGIINYELSKEYVRASDYDEIMHRGMPEIGDVLFTTEAPLGQVANIDRVDIALAQRIIKFRPNMDLNAYYLKYWIMSTGFQQFLTTLSTGSTATGIKASKLFMLPVLLPERSVQDSIVAYLDDMLLKIESSICDRQNMIQRLSEYKKSLIYEVVTGKKEV